MKESDLYRKQAVESFYEREDFQQTIRIITPKSWVYLIIFFMLIVAGVLWLIFGQISTLVEGQGIIFAKNAEIINVMSPISGGYVKQLWVRPGVKVKRGQLLATLVNPNMNSEAKELNNYIEQQKIKLAELTKTAKSEIDIRLKQIQDSVTHAQTINDSLQEKKNRLEALLKIQEAAFKKGILSRLELTDIQVAYYDSKEQITKNENTLIELNQEKNDYIESWNTKIRDLQEKLAQSQFNLKKLMENIKLTETVLSPEDGIISNEYVKPGDFLTEKQTLLNIITHNKDLEVIAFFNADVGKKIVVGMQSKVFPKHVNVLEYGGIVGKVTFVSELPITPEGLESILENQKMADVFEQNGPVFKVKIELDHSPDTPTGYRWTTSSGPKEKLSIGTVTKVEIVVKKEHPLSIILPILKSAKNWVTNKND
ncbi:NHLP bacteriocin system secretion protein [Legionella cincinnatiensis]|uniref:Multidrug resistance protein MdtN n=1 Tax=Legionella cincinnatiensis TaxID=28085 RepID=A0A378IST1_9GAMM|nr:NHLP bacteriocin system secretion protein [Legionella cincinnatiensis]KTC93265.1 multidrug resistance protein MdtN [Legionella cincinnatiensis]STX35034.1 multidrug resistance protein MdtN [Legionella cincinnatiensis]